MRCPACRRPGQNVTTRTDPAPVYVCEAPTCPITEYVGPIREPARIRPVSIGRVVFAVSFIMRNRPAGAGFITEE